MPSCTSSPSRCVCGMLFYIPMDIASSIFIERIRERTNLTTSDLVPSRASELLDFEASGLGGGLNWS